jgi:hypothetical protein
MRLLGRIARSLPPGGVSHSTLQQVVGGILSNDPVIMAGLHAHVEQHANALGGGVGGGVNSGDDSYGYDAGALEAPPPKGPAAEQQRAAMGANATERVKEAAFEAQRQYAVDGFRCELLQVGKYCDVDGCMRPLTTLCEDCRQPGFRFCALHDMEVHAHSGRAHRSRFTLLSPLLPDHGPQP